MAWQTLRYQLTSSAPLIMHNGQMANPLNKFAQELKKISGKRAKTDSDHIRMAEIEFMAGLYMGEQGPIIPNFVFDSMLVNAAKKSKEGTIAKSSVFCVNHSDLDYEGPRKAEDLWELEQFRHVALVRVGMARIARTRPVFTKWSTVAEFNVETTVVNPGRIDEWMEVAGTQVGLCDWRPQHGRFTVERLTE
jgi:hypothetical protein